jgi:hypothetical protein
MARYSALILVFGAAIAALLLLQNKAYSESVFDTPSVVQDKDQTSIVTKKDGPYMIAGGDRNMIWRINQSTGQVSYCLRDTNSADPNLIATRAPFCSAWSE